MENPYIVGRPVKGEDLVGRESELEFVLDALRAHDNTPILLHGQRRVGKSSILAHLRAVTLPIRGIASAYIDLQHYIDFSSDVDSRLEHILEGFVETFEKELAFRRPSRLANTSWGAYFVEELAPAVSQAVGGRPLVVLVDEFDSLPDLEESNGTLGQESAAHRLMALFNKLSSHRELAVSFVVVVGRQFDHLPQDIRALLKRVRAQHIWLLSEVKTCQLITKPVEELSIHFQPPALARIYELTQGHPYFTQALCYKIFQNLDYPDRKTVTPADVDNVLGTVFTTFDTGFSWLWDDLSATRKLILAALAEFEPSDSPATIADISNNLQKHHLRLEGLSLADELTYLVQHRTLRQIDTPGAPSRYGVTIELVRLWVKERNSIGDLEHRITSLIPSADVAYQRATLLHMETDPEKAQAELKNAVQQNPYHVDAQMALGDVLQRAGEHEAAIKTYRDAYALDPDRAKDALLAALLTYGANLEGQERYFEAGTVYREVLALESEESTVTQKVANWFEQGQSAYRRRNWPVAIQYLQRVVEIKADYQEAEANQLLEEAKTAASSISPKLHWLTAGCGAILLLTFGLLLFTGFGNYLGGAIGLIGHTPTNIPAISTPPIQTPIYVVITATSTGTATSTKTPVPTNTPMPTDQPTPTHTAIPTATATPTDTATPSPSPTQTPEEPTYTPSPTPTSPPLALPEGRALDVAVLNVTDRIRAVALIAGQGIFQSDDRGYRWEPLWQPDDGSFDIDSASFLDIAIAPSDPRFIYVAGFESVLYSHDGGRSWDISVGTLDKSGTLPAQAQVYSLAVGYRNPELVYAATDRGVFRSRDGGETWQALDQAEGRGFINKPIYAIAIDANGSDKIVYAAGPGDEVLFTTEANQHEFKWQINVCDACGSAIHALALAPDGAIFAGGAGSGGIVAKREANQTRWVFNGWGIPTPRVPNLVISNLVFDPTDPEEIYAGTGWRDNAKANGIYRSQDSGDTWHTMNTGLTTHEGSAPYAQGIAIASDGSVFIATHDGVYKLNETNIIWERQ